MADYARGERLRELRERKHQSQETAAYDLGVSTKSLRAWEHGGAIRWENAKRVARHYGVDPEELVAREPAADEHANGLRVPQLGRIEQRLNELYALLTETSESAPSEEAARVLGDAVDHIEEAAESRSKPAPARSASSLAGRRRGRA